MHYFSLADTDICSRTYLCFLPPFKRERVSTMVWLFWLFYPGAQASGLLLSRPVTSVQHSDNFFLTNSLCPLSTLTSPQQLTFSFIVVVIMTIFVGIIPKSRAWQRTLLYFCSSSWNDCVFFWSLRNEDLVTDRVSELPGCPQPL